MTGLEMASIVSTIKVPSVSGSRIWAKDNRMTYDCGLCSLDYCRRPRQILPRISALYQSRKSRCGRIRARLIPNEDVTKNTKPQSISSELPRIKNQIQEDAFVSAAAEKLKRKPGVMQRLGRIFQWSSPYDSQIFQLAGPALLTLAADPLLSIVDTIYVGKLGAAELGALGVNTGVFSFAFLFLNFLAITTTPLVASAVATDNKEKAGQATVQSLILATVLGVPLFFGLVVFVDPILKIMGATDDIMHVSKDYYLTRAFAAPAALFCLSGQGVFRGLQDTRTPLAITVAANLLNFFLDPLLIYGLHMGIKGAALATASAEVLSAVAYCALIWRRKTDLGLDCSVGDALRRAQANYWPFVESGGTVILRSGVLLGTRTLASSVATHLGAVPIAAHQVVAQLWLLHNLLSDSLAIAGQSIVATEIAQQTHRQRARRVSDRLLQLGGGLGVLTAVVYTMSAPILPYIFTNDMGVAGTIYSVLPLAIVMLPINSIACVFDGILWGAEDFQFMAKAMVASSTVASSTLLLVEPCHWGLIGVWLSQSGLFVLRVAILNRRYQDSNGPVPPVK